MITEVKTTASDAAPADRPPIAPAARASAGAHPAAAVPVRPVLSFASFFDNGAPPVRSILDVGAAKLVTSGRVAIALALKQMKVGPGDSVLVPSFHCASMIEPVIWSGATPVFYRINPDTSVDLDDVAAKLDGATKVLMATNYFGFPQDLPTLRAFCDMRGLALLEDCAHCFLGEKGGQPVGSFGDYAIASSMKFLPIYEGGMLVSSRHPLDAIALGSAGAGFEAKAALNALEDSFEYKRLGFVKALLALPMALKDMLWGRIKARTPSSAQSLVPGSSEGGFGFDPAWLNKRASLFSRLMLKVISRPRIGALRRKNYLKLAQAVEQLPGCRTLFRNLPHGVFPWVFPLVIDNPESIFNRLKSQGVPMLRFGEYLWPGVDATVCANSVDLSRRVISFPCHQELREDEMDWMILKIKEALLSPAQQAI